MNSSNLVSFNTIYRREITRFMRIWGQTILPPAITMTLYFVIFGHFIGRRIGTIEGFTYMQYLAPGLIMMSVITNSYSNVVSSFFSARLQRHIEELLVSPTPNIYILLGYVFGGICRGIITGFVITIIALSFTHLKIHSVTITISVVLLTSMLFALAGFANAIFARKIDDTSIVSTFILTPLTYFGGVFFSVSALSSVWYHISHFNPILYMVNSFRYGILGITDVNIGLAFAIMIGLNIILFCLNLTLLNKGIGIRT